MRRAKTNATRQVQSLEGLRGEVLLSEVLHRKILFGWAFREKEAACWGHRVIIISSPRIAARTGVRRTYDKDTMCVFLLSVMRRLFHSMTTPLVFVRMHREVLFRCRLVISLGRRVFL